MIRSYAIPQRPIGGQFGIFFPNRQMECAHSVKGDFTNHHVDMVIVRLIEDDVDGGSGVFVTSEPNSIPGGKDPHPFYRGFNFHALNPLMSQNDNDFSDSFTSEG